MSKKQERFVETCKGRQTVSTSKKNGCHGKLDILPLSHRRAAASDEAVTWGDSEWENPCFRGDIVETHPCTYCWWLKSCVTKDDDYPIIYKVLTIPGGAGFLPSTVYQNSRWLRVPTCPSQIIFWSEVLCIGCVPLPVKVTTRITTFFRIGDP